MKSRILFEDESILVCFKPAGLAVQSGRVGEADMVSELKKYLWAAGRDPWIGLVHRLDQPVSGLLVFAKTPEAAAELSRQAAGKGRKEQGGSGRAAGRAGKTPGDPSGKAVDSGGRWVRPPGPFMEKEYSALLYVQRAEELPEAGEKRTLVHELVRDSGRNLSRVAEKGTPGAKQARLELWITGREELSEEKRHVTARIRLLTGRHHQIRVQCAATGLPLLGDQRYGSKESREYSACLGISSVCLCADRLSFSHPVTGKRLEYHVEELPWKK